MFLTQGIACAKARRQRMHDMPRNGVWSNTLFVESREMIGAGGRAGKRGLEPLAGARGFWGSGDKARRFSPKEIPKQTQGNF